MNHLTGSDLCLFLDDVFQNKLPLLSETKSWQIYQAPLADRRTRLKKLYRPDSGKPLAEELAETDRLHDSTGRAIYNICDGLEQLVTLSGEKRDLVRDVRETFVPALGTLMKSYEDEAGKASKKREALTSMAAGLRAFPVAPDLTLYTLVEAHVDAGERLGQLLAQRAEATVEEQTTKDAEAAVLRNETVGLVGRFRRTLADEIAVNTDLHRNLETQIFAYLDQLAASRADRAPKKHSATGPTQA